MKVLRYFVWTLFPLSALLIYLIFGLPHVIWSYSWRDDGQGYDPYAARHYYTCTFIGPYGEVTVDARNGRCGWILFRKAMS